MKGLTLLFVFQFIIGNAAELKIPFENIAFESICKQYSQDLKPVRQFIYPVNLKNYGIAQEFGNKNPKHGGFHLGTDWMNFRNHKKSIGDPIKASADGLVFFAGKVDKAWGFVVRVLHKVKEKEQEYYIESFYAHLESVQVKEGQTIKIGDILGKLGNCEGIWDTHLHYEMRLKFYSIGAGYTPEAIPNGFIDANLFIKSHSK